MNQRLEHIQKAQALLEQLIVEFYAMSESAGCFAAIRRRLSDLEDAEWTGDPYLTALEAE